MRTSVIIPTLNAQAHIVTLLDSVLAQTIVPEIVVVDSESSDATVDLVRQYGNRVKLLQIPRASFDHGATRDMAFRSCSGDYVLFLTQDALPMDVRYIEKLLAAFAEPDIAAVCGRQVAFPGASAYERLTREFNYPSVGRITRKQDILTRGIKAFFFSNVCSAYRRDAYEAVGGFDAPIACNEDMMMAAKLLDTGYAVAYTPQAAVWHSHHHTLREEYERNRRAGLVMQHFAERLADVQPKGEGARMVRHVSKELLRAGRLGSCLVFLTHAISRFAGYRDGERMGRRSRT